MSPLAGLLVAVHALVFLAWAWALLSAALEIRRRGLALRTGWRDGPASEWRGLGDWWRDPARAPQRRRLSALTVAVLALTLLWEAAGLDPSP